MLRIIGLDFQNRQDLNSRGLHVSQSFLKNLDCKIIKGIQRINFIFVNDTNDQIELLELDSSIPTIRILVEFVEFESNSFALILGEYIFRGLNMIFDVKGWSEDSLKLAYHKSLEEKFIAPIKVSKYVYHENRLRRAELYIQIKEEYISLFVVIQDKIKRGLWNNLEIPIDKIHLNPFLIHRYFSNIIWVNNTLEISDDNHEIIHKIDVGNKLINIFYNPKENDLNTLKGYVKNLNYKTGENGMDYLAYK